MKDKITVISFLAVLGAAFFLSLFKAPDDVSYAERRRLAQFPELTLSGVLNGAFMKGFDDYAVDQIAFRDQYRRLKALFDLNVLRKLDNNGIFIKDDRVFKTEYPLNEDSILRLSDNINTSYDRHLAGMNVWYAIVPDKNHYLEDSSHLIMDYRRLEEIVRGRVYDGIQYISLFDALSPEDYFRTDSHWKQERLGNVTDTLAERMGFTLGTEPYTIRNFDNFYGVFYGQAALPVRPDTLSWLVSSTTENAVVTSAEKPEQVFPVYDEIQLGSMDSYSLFMCGPAAIVTAHNPLNDSGRGLIVFRDSFASSLAPLLLDAYSTVTMIDLRYINPELVSDFVDFAGQDVLFIYSAAIFNTSDSIRGWAAPSPAALPFETQDSPFVSPFVARGRLLE